MSFAQILQEAHSGVRWLVVLGTVVALVWMLLGIIQSKAYDAQAKRVMMIFTRLIEIQWLLGLILFITVGIRDGFSVGFRWEHLAIMTIAVAVPHMTAMFKKRPDAVQYRAGLALVLVTLALVFIGVSRLPQGWLG